ncbi:hypothetical protein D3C85_1436440 [compost metagenome]
MWCLSQEAAGIRSQQLEVVNRQLVGKQLVPTARQACGLGLQLILDRTGNIGCIQHTLRGIGRQRSDVTQAILGVRKGIGHLFQGLVVTKLTQRIVQLAGHLADLGINCQCSLGIRTINLCRGRLLLRGLLFGNAFK